MPSKSRTIRWGVAALCASVVLAACGGPATGTTAPTTAATQAAPTPAAEDTPAGEQLSFYYVSPVPIGVNDFLIMGETGLEAAGAKHNATTEVLESENDPSSREENVRAAVNDGADLVIVLGFEFNDIIPRVATEAPDVQFLIVDQCIENPPANVHCAVFREYEAAYLIGVEAALLSETGTVGAISALDIPFLHRYTDGFAMGAQAVNPDIEVSTLWVGTDVSAFSDPARAKEQALAMAAQGADHIFAAGAASNFGIFEAAEEEGFMTYGVDVNQCPSAPGHVVDNLLKRVDTAIVQAVDSIQSGGGETFLSYGLAEGGLGLVPFALDNPEESQCVIMDHPDIIEQVREYQERIISGEITIPDPMQQ
jgi:basic membrane protein A